MSTYIIDILLRIKIDRIITFMCSYIPFQFKLRRYEIESNQKIKFVCQGNYNLSLLGDLSKFKIHSTSHLKSDTTIECTGGVEIGEYFHTGRGLTIFSTNHNYNDIESIPYGKKSINKPVIIKDFVWIGANVTIVPGITIGEGVIIGAGSVVSRNVPDCAVVCGNPAKVVKYRNKEQYYQLKQEGKFQ